MAKPHPGNDPFARAAEPADPESAAEATAAEVTEPSVVPEVFGPPPEEPAPVAEPPVARAPAATEPAAPPEELRAAAPEQDPPVADGPHLRLVEVPEPAGAETGAPAATTSAAPASMALPIDDFGLDPAFEARALERLKPLYEKWFRVQVRGLEHVPASGRVLLVANHAGALPWDLAMLKCAVAFAHPSGRRVRPLIVDSLFHLPFVGVAANRFGAVRACQENAEALLDAGEAVAVFPEGDKGIQKPFTRRYRLQRFGRGGFVKLALRTRTTIVPVAIVGAEEVNPLLAPLRRAASALGLPFLPLTPTFPLLGPAGLLPLPAKWSIDFLPPVVLEGDPADELTVQRHAEDVRDQIQRRLDERVKARSNPFF